LHDWKRVENFPVLRNPILNED
jgi:hypothetical protein